VVNDRRTPLSEAKAMRMGSKIVDGGHYIFTQDERADFLKKEPGASALMRPLIGSREYINGQKRWILRLADVDPKTLRGLPLVMDRISDVKKFRAKSKKPKTRELAGFPTAFEVTTVPIAPFLCIPEVSSERREYVPIGWQQPPTIPSNLIQVLLDADLSEFGVLTSRMHMAWLRNIGGRLKSDYRYSIGIVYNPFPWPDAEERDKVKVRALAQAVLDARAAHPGATLADLYDPDVMPADLRKAHHALDAAVDRLYRSAPFGGDRERVEHLFGLYEKLIAPLAVAAKPKRAPRTKAMV
jgi:restriction-modification enzyme MmeI-like protein